jgi:hypothetical protein
VLSRKRLIWTFPPTEVFPMTLRPILRLAALALFAASPAVAAEPALKTLTIDTGRSKDGGFTLAGRDAYQQLVVTGEFADGKLGDLTGKVAYDASPAGVVEIDATGFVTPLQEGKAIISAKGPGGATAQTAVTVTHLVQDVPVNFANQVTPIFTKFGCNSGGCHGKASGQNGFKLSLLGFEPAEDYEYVVKEARGRRLFQAAPAFSLLLLKATGTVAHGGGKKLEVGSPFYKVLVRWVEQGAPYGGKDDPTVDRIEVFPRERLLQRGGEQQLTVVAHLSDGSTVDVTRMTQFESNSADLAEVSGTGLVSVKQIPGNAAIMARFQSHVDVFRATVPLGAPVANLPPAKNFIDELVFGQLKKLGLPPSPACDDGTFIRRATIDLAGRLPTRAETEEFVADKDSAKHDKLIDRLLASPDYADYFANKWSAVLRNRRKTANEDSKPTFAFHAWIRESLHENKPFDQFVREILTATGEEVANPPVAWYREVRDAAAQMEDMSQLFLAQRIGCAKCHHHPFEKWSQEDYYGLTAFFTQVQITDPPQPRPAKGQKTAPPKPPFSVAVKAAVPKAVNPKTNKPVAPTGLGSPPMTVAQDADARARLADWMADPKNPFFGRALVNRYWKHFLGRGLVEPEDDMRVTNPPTNPELLDALARHFVEHKYDLKDLVRTICTSQVYRLSAVPNEYNADDRQNYSRYLPKRLHAEVLLDAIDEVTQAKSQFKGVPAGTRAVQLPDNQFDSYFLSVFGRPDSASACECERSGDASLAQCLHMFNSSELLSKVAGPRAKALAADKRPAEERIRELYLVALSRPPSAEEIAVMKAFIDKKNGAASAYEDIMWVVVNTKEFLFNH